MDKPKQLNVVMKAKLSETNKDNETTENVKSTHHVEEIDFTDLFPPSSGYSFQTVIKE